MKLKFLCVVLVAIFSAGCQQSKAKACKGCQGPELSDCQFAYEECPSTPNCRRSDVKRKYADNICLYTDTSTQ